MADTSDVMSWKFLSDSAVQSSDQDKFKIHAAYAKVIYSIAKTCETPFSIALYSGWGTGKTSICNLAQKLCADNKNVHYVYLDVWKYSNEPLKRWILLETHRSLSEQRAISDYKFGGRSLQSHLEFEESWEDHDRLKVNFAAARWLGIGVAVAICAFFASLFFAPKLSFTGQILTIVTAFAATGGLATFLFQNVVKELFKSLSGLVFDRKVRHVSAQPAFSAEKFAEIFRDMIHEATFSAGSEEKRIIFVFDNLDRCSEAVAVETIGVIKTYLDEPRCVYIIPCDETALLKHISKSYISQDGDGGQKYAREFLNKFFQATLRLPIIPDFDFEMFLDEQLGIAGMGDLPPDARDVLVLGYLGQTPRQIKRVLNDLTAFRSLAVEAESEGLVENGALTSNLSLLTKMSVISVQWPAFLTLLADDPELWAELNRKILIGENFHDERIAAGLLSFLHATKHVSSEADVRPFIYLKRPKYERNQALASAVQSHLRKGESKEFLGLLPATKSSSEQEDVIRIAHAQTRSWLDAQPPRDIFLKNSASVLLKFAGTIAGNRLLDLTISDLLEYVMSHGKAFEIPEVFPLPDLFAFTPTVNAGQKEKCLDRIAGLFPASGPLPKNYAQYWEQFLEHEGQLSPELRLTLRNFLESRYAASESDTLELLSAASKRKSTVSGSDLEWAVSTSLLAQVASRLTFVKDEADAQRISAILAFQSQLGEDAKSAATHSVVRALQGTRTKNFDAQAEAAVDFLNKLGPEILGQSLLDLIAEPLVEQVRTQGNYQLKAPWLAPLVVHRGTLSANLQSSVDSLYRPLLQDPTDPAGLTQLLTAMTQPVCAHLLQVQENLLAMRAQAQQLENRLGATNAPAMREQILNCFPSSSIVAELGIFDEGRAWDLALFPKTVSRAKREGVVDESLRQQVGAFIDRFLKGRSQAFSSVLDQLLASAKERPEILNETTARALSECCFEVLGSNVEKYFAEVRFLSTKLSGQWRLWAEKEIANRFVGPREAHWVQVLLKISEDVAGDEALSADKSFIDNLMDHAFEAARVSPAEASGVLVNLFPHLQRDRAKSYVVEAQDRLIALESAVERMPQMEPYLRILRTAGPALGEVLPQRLADFCDRMLGPAKTDDERTAVLSFLRDTKLQWTDKSLAERILKLVPNEDALAETSRKAIAQSVPTEVDAP